jgi:hypothetical protein
MKSWTIRCGNFSLRLVMLAGLHTPPFAADVTLLGLIGAKTIVAIDGGAPRKWAYKLVTFIKSHYM